MSESSIVIYTSGFCPYCHWAKKLLKQKAISFEEIRVDKTPGKRDEMLERSGGRYTVPQIFIGKHHVGGFDDMADLDRQGRLDPLIEDALGAA